MTASVLEPEWNLSEEGINLITNNGNIRDKRTILENALNADLRKIAQPLTKLPLSSNNCVSKIVLQIDKIRNVSAPKVNETSQAAPRMLRLDLVHDSKFSVQALEISHIPSLNIEKTPPGTKLLINGAKIESSYLILNSSSCSLLGGKVPNLIEKWEMSKTTRKQNSGNDGPPAWVNFGKKIQSNESTKPVKVAKIEEPKKENTEFDSQRQSAINSAANSGAIKKVFGGGVTVAKEPARETHNNHRKQENHRENRPREGRNFKTRENRDRNDRGDEEPLERRSDNVSLFAFLEDKLPESTTKVKKQPQNDYNRNNVKNVQSNYRNDYVEPQNSYRSYERVPKHTNYRNNEQSNYKNNENVHNNHRNHERNYDYRQNQHANAENANFDANLVNGFNKMTINNEFASRSLRQHLNLERKPNESVPSAQSEKAEEMIVGQECMAKYWEDGKHYNAVITAITDKTYVVKFKGYGNMEEVIKTDCMPVKNKNYSNNTRKPYNHNQFSGTLEFRRGKNANSFSNQK